MLGTEGRDRHFERAGCQHEGAVARTNVVVDEALIRRVMQLYGLRSKRAAIDFALRALVGDRPPRDSLDLEGAGWDGDLSRIRSPRMRRI